jgi:4-amino-4-deoxy-L-arabinose transferase-like glycosyltransferase
LWQSVLDSLVAALICLLLEGRVRRRWSVAAGMIYALHPAAVLYASSILSESLFTFLFTLAVAGLIFGIRRDRVSWAAAAGVVMGLAALCRPVATPFFIVVAAVIWLSRKSVRRPFRMAAAFSVAMILAMAPWFVRSSVAAGHFVLVSAGPVNFALATAPERWNLNDQSSIWQNEHYWRAGPCGRALAQARTPPEAVRADQVCLQVAIANLRSDPKRYVRNRITQLVHFPLSSFDVVTGNTTSIQAALRQRAYGVLGMKLGLWSFFSLIPLLAGLLGMFAGRPAIENRLCGALWVFTILIHLPGYVEYRYFLPAVPMLLVTAAYGFDWLEQRHGRVRRNQIAL